MCCWRPGQLGPWYGNSLTGWFETFWSIPSLGRMTTNLNMFFPIFFQMATNQPSQSRVKGCSNTIFMNKLGEGPQTILMMIWCMRSVRIYLNSCLAVLKKMVVSRGTSRTTNHLLPAAHCLPWNSIPCKHPGVSWRRCFLPWEQMLGAGKTMWVQAMNKSTKESITWFCVTSVM